MIFIPQIGSKRLRKRLIDSAKNTLQLWLCSPERKMKKKRKKDTNFIMVILLKRKIRQLTKEERKAPNSRQRIVQSRVLNISRNRVLQQRIRMNLGRQKLNSYPKKVEICIYCVVDL